MKTIIIAFSIAVMPTIALAQQRPAQYALQASQIVSALGQLAESQQDQIAALQKQIDALNRQVADLKAKYEQPQH